MSPLCGGRGQDVIRSGVVSDEMMPRTRRERLLRQDAYKRGHDAALRKVLDECDRILGAALSRGTVEPNK